MEKASSDADELMNSIIKKWGGEMLRLQIEAEQTRNTVEAVAYGSVSAKISEFLDDLDLIKNNP